MHYHDASVRLIYEVDLHITGLLRHVSAVVQLHAEDMLCIKVVHMFFELEIMVQGDKVKKGQTVAYIEQLGTFVPVEVRSHHFCWLHRCIQTQHLYGQLLCIVAHCWCWHDLHMCAVIYACVSNQSCHSSVMTSRSRYRRFRPFGKV